MNAIPPFRNVSSTSKATLKPVLYFIHTDKGVVGWERHSHTLLH